MRRQSRWEGLMNCKVHDPEKREATAQLQPIITCGSESLGLPHWPIFQDKP